MNFAFNRAVSDDVIERNPLKEEERVMDYAIPQKTNEKKGLGDRLGNEGLLAYIQTAKTFFKSYKNFSRPRQSKYKDVEMRCFLVTSFMVGRRVEELLKLRFENITKNGVARIYTDDTKSNIYDRYPLPPEFFDMVQNFDHSRGYSLAKFDQYKGEVFPNFVRATVFKYQRELLEKMDVELHSNEKLYGHDKRDLFVMTMGRITNDREMVDRMFSHAPQNKLKEKYQPVDIEIQTEVFEVYWDILRGKLNENDVVEAVKKWKFGLGYLYNARES